MYEWSICLKLIIASSIWWEIANIDMYKVSYIRIQNFYVKNYVLKQRGNNELVQFTVGRVKASPLNLIHIHLFNSVASTHNYLEVYGTIGDFTLNSYKISSFLNKILHILVQN